MIILFLQIHGEQMISICRYSLYKVVSAFTRLNRSLIPLYKNNYPGNFSKPGDFI